MKVFGRNEHRAVVARMLVIVLALPLATAARAPAQQQADAQQSSSPAAQPAQGTPPADGQQQDQNQPPRTSQADTDTQQDGQSKPLGTAAAPAEKPTGVTGSRPEGAVIAPAKQRRVRSILIKVGVIVAAGVAIGTVAALSKSSPSRPQ